VLFFDMTGTAIASLSRGLGYGVVVALASNIAGAIFLPALPGFDPDIYMWFGFTNAVGAIVWATAPRIIVHFQKNSSRDFLSTDPSAGYRTLLYQISAVGAVAGLTVGLAGLLTQYLALGCSSSDMLPCTQANPAVRSGHLISTFFHIGTLDWMLPGLTLLSFGILDKIVATASAMMIIFMFHEVPNYNQQSKKLKSYRESEKGNPRAFRIAIGAYVCSLLFFFVLYGKLLFGEGQEVTPGKLAMFILTIILLAIFLLRPGGVPLYNAFHRSNVEATNFYHDKTLIAAQSVHRDVYEDIMKTVIIVITLSGLIIEQVQSKLLEANRLSADLAVYPVGAAGMQIDQRFLTLAAPIVFLNLWRYFIVFLARYSGTLYRDAAPLTLSPRLRWALPLLGVAFLIWFTIRALR
jgi:hypothetical protein